MNKNIKTSQNSKSARSKSMQNSINKKKEKDYVVIDFSQKKSYDASNRFSNIETSKATMEEFKRVKKIIDKESASVKKKKKVNKKRRKAIIILWTSLIIIIVLIITCIILMLTLPIFNISRFEIKGTERYIAEDIASTTNLNIGTNIFISLFKLNKNGINNIYPYIETLNIRYKFPSVIKFDVNERKSRYYAFNKDDSCYYLLDKEGYILDKLEDSSLWEDEILVVGITFENNVVLGDKINDIDIKRLGNFEKFYNELTTSIQESKVTRVTFVNEYMKIYVNSKIEIVFESRKDISDYNFLMVKAIMNDVEGQMGIIDMTRKDPTFVKN